MDLHGRRSGYSLLSQNQPEDHIHPPTPLLKFGGGGGGAYYESHSGGKGKSDRGGFDWELIDHKSRMPTTSSSASIGLQRQSSGSSFGESSLSGGDYYGVPSLSNPEQAFGHLMHDVDYRLQTADVSGGVGGGGGSSSSKSWAQQTEESYQLQLALAFRLSSEATCAEDPNFLDPVPDECASRSSVTSTSPETMSHRFWVSGSLSYSDKVPDGFYLIHGMDPYVWTLCSDLQENGRVPSIESLKSVDPSILPSVEVILIDKRNDPSLHALLNRVHSMSSGCTTTDDVVDQLAKLVCNHMGGGASTGEEELLPTWKECSDDVKDCVGSIVFPIGSLSVGLCRHRALLFKVLADSIDLPCRIAKGCKYCNRDDTSSCLVRFSLDREYLVDLIGFPGCIHEPDSLLNGPSSISISSPLRLPRLRQIEPTVDFKALAKQYFFDIQSLNLVFDDSSAVMPIPGRINRAARDAAAEKAKHERAEELKRKEAVNLPRVDVGDAVPEIGAGGSSTAAATGEAGVTAATPVSQVLHELVVATEKSSRVPKRKPAGGADKAASKKGKTVPPTGGVAASTGSVPEQTINIDDDIEEIPRTDARRGTAEAPQLGRRPATINSPHTATLTF